MIELNDWHQMMEADVLEGPIKTLALNLGATAPYGALLTFRGAEILRGRYIQKV